MKKLFLLLAVVMMATLLQAAPKKLLVVTTTTGFRHSSIPTVEKILAQLAKDSGEFTVDFVRAAARSCGNRVPGEIETERQRRRQGGRGRMG